jgi:hypothetical protein
MVWKIPPPEALEDVVLLDVPEPPVGFFRPKSVALNVEENSGPGGTGERKAGVPDSTKPSWSWIGAVVEFHQLPTTGVYHGVNDQEQTESGNTYLKATGRVGDSTPRVDHRLAGVGGVKVNVDTLRRKAVEGSIPLNGERL